MVNIRTISKNNYLVLVKYTSIKDKEPELTSFNRIIETYSPSEVHYAAKTTKLAQYHPIYDAEIPIVTPDKNTIICSGVEACKTYLSLLSVIAPEYIEFLSLLSRTEKECIYITGSLALGYMREYSDIDIVMDISKPHCIDLPLEIETLAKPLDKEILDDWIARESRTRNTKPLVARKNYTPWRRFIFRNRIFSTSLVSITRRTQVERRIFYIDKLELLRLLVEIEPSQESLGDYPGIVVTTGGDIIVIYDQFYLPKLFEGGKFVVEGVKGYLVDSRDNHVEEAVFVGLHELDTKIEPLS